MRLPPRLRLHPRLSHRLSHRLSLRLRLALGLMLAMASVRAEAAIPAEPALPAYVADPSVHGVIRMAGSDLNHLVLLWQADFARLQPGVRFENRMVSGDAAIGALESGAADLVANGREPVLTEFLSFAEAFGHDGPFQVAVATGSHEKLGRTWAQVIWVNGKNPIAHMTMKQLDGVFGAARTGGYDGYKWTTRLARAGSQDIRTWGQLGLAGPWAARPIHTYGYAPTGMSNFFEQVVFHGGTTWAPGYRQFVEASAKQLTEPSGGTDRMMSELEADPEGVAWAGLAHGQGHPGLRTIALGEAVGGPFVTCTRETVRSHAYPLARSVFMQMDRAPGAALAPPLRAFLRYILSREGQAIVDRQDEYLSLTPALAAAQRKALD